MTTAPDLAALVRQVDFLAMTSEAPLPFVFGLSDDDVEMVAPPPGYDHPIAILEGMPSIPERWWAVGVIAAGDATSPTSSGRVRVVYAVTRGGEEVCYLRDEDSGIDLDHIDQPPSPIPGAIPEAARRVMGVAA